jgi:hypothetical protein
MNPTGPQVELVKNPSILLHIPCTMEFIVCLIDKRHPAKYTKKIANINNYLY